MKMTVRHLILLILFAGAVGFVAAPASAKSSAPEGQSAAQPPAPADAASIPADAEKSASGLAWKVLKPGDGKARPTLSDTVTVNYDAWTSTGRLFDSTTVRKRPSVFPLSNIAVKGMAEGIQLLTVGERRRFWMPAEIAFNNAPGKPQGMCVFEIELLEFKPTPAETTQAIPAPPDVAAPPPDAEKTKSGLASKVLKQGTGKTHPTSFSRVTVHYTGWTTDGRMFDSSVGKDPATFPLDQVIRGWTEGVQLMVVGEKRRFWIPGNLAYGDKPSRPGAPAGMLVFDVELLGIQ